MGKISVEFIFDAPALIGGADSGNEAELQVAGLLGMLRFWFRVRNVAEYHDEQEAFRKIEFALFGASASEENRGRGQGTFTAWLERAPELSRTKLPNNDSRRELLHFGNGYVNRPCLPGDSSFTLHILINPHAPPPDDIDVEDELIETLKIMGLLGGVGYGWRRGFGSLRLVRLKNENNEIELNVSCPEEYEQALRNILVHYMAGTRDHPNGIPAVSQDMLAHFSRETVIDIKTCTQTPPEGAHKALADAARSAATTLSAGSAAEFFSDQTDPNSRRPSPVGIHLRKCGDNTLITVTRLRPYWIGNANLDRIDDFLINENFTRLP